MKNWWKIIIALSIWMIGLNLVSCNSINKTLLDDYSLCNATSINNMAETENGFFYIYHGQLYYADKAEMSVWVPVCNKADCSHTGLDCNANVSMQEIIEKDGKLYGLGLGIDGRPFVYEFLTDGSGSKRVYELPYPENNFIHSFKGMMTQDQLIVSSWYLQENGMYLNELSYLENNELHTLYSEESETQNNALNMSARVWWRLRGDNVILSQLLVEEWSEFETTLWRITDGNLEEVVLPEGASPQYSYLSGDTFIYFKQNEGFYKFDFSSGTQELLFENQLENSRGYVLTENYMIESNRYKDNSPEEAFVKFYNGEEWINVEVPDEIAKTDYAFTVESVASDRVFFRLGNNMGEQNELHRLYYFMIEEENPKLVSSFIEIKEEENELINTTEESSEKIEDDFENVVIVDNDEIKVEITNIYLEDEEMIFDFYWNNKTSNKNFIMMIQSSSINGLQCNLSLGEQISAGKESSERSFSISQTDFERNSIDIEPYYNLNEFTDIEITFHIMNLKDGNQIFKTVQLYPYGEDNIIEFSREEKDTDKVLIDNDYVTVYLTGYNNTGISNSEICLVMKNNAEEQLKGYITELRVNGKFIPLSSSWTQFYIDSNCWAFHNFDMFGYIEGYEFNVVEEIEFLFEIYSDGDSEDAQLLMGETIKLNPIE